MTTPGPMDGDLFHDATFEDLDFGAFSLHGKDFVGCRFRRVRMAGARWSGARIEACVFEGCDLSRLVPGDGALLDVRFEECELQGAVFERLAATTTVAFEGCRLRYASFAGCLLRGTPFLNCTLTEASFLDCDLQEARFDRSDLSAAAFQGCDLRRADVSSASGALIDPAKNRVKGARLSLASAGLLAASYGFRLDGAAGRGRDAKRRR